MWVISNLEAIIQLDLSGKTALVSGASQGIGAATASELASLGASVVMLARSQDKLEAISRDLERKSESQKHSYISLDLSDREQLGRELKALLNEVGPVQILVCNAGGPKGGPLTEANDEEFLKAFETHVLANQLMVKELTPGMQQSGYGRIINIISTSVKIPIPNLGVSNTIRGAVANWAKTLAGELAPYGITVNNVLPGYTATPRLENLMTAAGQRLGKTPKEIEKLWQDSVPMKRFADPKETAQAIAFLASPAASYITGINLPVDGGRTGCL